MIATTATIAHRCNHTPTVRTLHRVTRSCWSFECGCGDVVFVPDARLEEIREKGCNADTRPVS